MELRQIIGKANEAVLIFSYHHVNKGNFIQVEKKNWGRPAVKHPALVQRKKMDERQESIMPFKLSWSLDTWLTSNPVLRTVTLVKGSPK